MQKYCYEKKLMGTRANITLYAESHEEDFIEQINDAFFTFHNFEQKYSLFRSESEISIINRHAGTQTAATPELMEIATYAIRLAGETGGIFNPLVGKATSPNGAAEKIDPGAYKKIIINQGNRTIKIPADTALDLNSIVKGMAIDRAMQSIREENAMIEAGGDILVKGLPPGKPQWQIGIRDPKNPANILTVLNFKTGAICTSGNYFRKDLAKQENRRHLINPKAPDSSGQIASMTVTAGSAREADALSTAAFFMSVEQAVEFIESHEGCSCLIIDNDNEVFMSPRMQLIFTTSSND